MPCISLTSPKRESLLAPFYSEERATGGFLELTASKWQELKPVFFLLQTSGITEEDRE